VLKSYDLAITFLIRKHLIVSLYFKNLLDMQINSVPFHLLNFRKLITGDEKWIL